jgi:DNA-binding CsgD family transcriptional regulator
MQCRGSAGQAEARSSPRKPGSQRHHAKTHLAERPRVRRPGLVRTSALAEYRQVGARRDEARVRWRLRHLGIRRRHWSTSPGTRPAVGWHSHTDAEQAVACVVAEGLNNNQVAARTYISTHTVAHHLRQVFRELSITSR